MLTVSQMLPFLFTALLLTATPGPDNLMVLSVGASQGKRSGVAFGLGCALGCLSHTLLAVIGVSALVAASPVAFTLLKALGGAYLMLLGIQALRHAGNSRLERSAISEISVLRTFFKGFIANTINPKVILFFLSFLPQFIDASRGDVQWQLGALGLLFTLQAAILFTMIGLFSGSVGAWLNRQPSVGRAMDRLAGVVFIALGLRMITSR